MNILVTGGAGFIGSSLAEKLKNTYKVVSIDNYHTGSKENHLPEVDYHCADISEITDFSQYGKFDCVFHCAACARIQKSFKDQDPYIKSNILGTHNISNYCAKNNTPLIYTGSSSHHGGKFSNLYTFTKDIGEEIILLYQKIFNLKATICRLYNVYGPREATNDNATLIGKLKYNYLHNLPFIIYGDGSKKRDFTHIDDITDGLISVLEKNKYNYVFELGRGKNYSIKEVIDMFEYDNIIYKEDLEGEIKETLAQNAYAKEVLNWNPEKDLDNYIKMIKYSL